MAFRILDQNPVYLDAEGNPVAGGELRFYESGTTTPKSVYGGPGLSPDNGSTVELDAEGRASVDVWGDGNYRVRLYDALGVQIWQQENVQQSGGTGTVFPPLESGKFFTTDGANILMQAIRQLPDPTGSAGRYVTTDGVNYLLAQLPTAAQPDIVVGAASFQAGTSASTTKTFMQTGTGSAPSSGTKSTSVSVTFPTAFTTLGHVGVQLTSDVATPSGALPRDAVTTSSATGFTVEFNTTTGGTSADNFSGSNINNAVPFTWFAIGTKVVP